MYQIPVVKFLAETQIKTFLVNTLTQRWIHVNKSISVLLYTPTHLGDNITHHILPVAYLV